MNAATFTKVVHEFFESWFKLVALHISKGEITIYVPYSYPTMLRVGESPSHFIAELVGSTEFSPSHKPYKLHLPKKPERFPNTDSFFNPGFDIHIDQKANPQFAVSSQGSTFSNITFCTEYDKATFLKKVNFPISDAKIKSTFSEKPLSIQANGNYLLFRHIDLIRTDSFRVLFRTISTAFVIRKSEEATSLSNWLTQSASFYVSQKGASFDVLGLNFGFDATSEGFARQLASLSYQNISERTIDRFIQTHDPLFAKALGYRRALPQVELQWVDRIADDPMVSKPDYILERDDGFFDILDLKKALLTYKSVTTGKKARIRFNAYVSDLTAQLSGYKRYFSSQKNLERANDEYGIKVRNPQLIGVVGNYDSFQREKVDLALEQYKDSITILSYHELINLLRKRSN